MGCRLLTAGSSMISLAVPEWAVPGKLQEQPRDAHGRSLGGPRGGPKRGLLQEGSPEALQLLSHVKRNNAIPEKKCLWLAREAFFCFENLDLNRCALGCARGPVRPPLDPIWAPKGCDQEFRTSRGPPWAVHPVQKGPLGRPFGRPEVAPEGLGAVFKT